jgi:tagaturonate reductase
MPGNGKESGLTAFPILQFGASRFLAGTQRSWPTVNLKPYERPKLFIPNLCHTYLAEIWRGRAPALTVREAVADRAFRLELDALFDEEALPVFAGTGMGKEAEACRATVIERSSNPFLDRRLSEIFINHEAKKRRRFGGPIELAEANGVGVKQPRLKAALAD